MKAPGLTTVVEGHSKTLYMQNVKSIEERTKPNLKKTLKELGLVDGQELVVADVTTPSSLVFLLQISGNEAWKISLRRRLQSINEIRLIS